jgi:hypothetical protein
MVICTDCIRSYKPNYHMITTTTAPWPKECLNFQRGSIFHGLGVVIILHFIKVLKFNYTILIYKGQHSTSRHHKIPKINGDLFVLCVMFFAVLLFVFWSLCYLSYFELWILITPCYLQSLLTHYSGWCSLNAEWVMFLIGYIYSDFENACCILVQQVNITNRQYGVGSRPTL